MASVYVERLDHLGLLASTIGDLGLISMIDARLVPDEQEGITPGKAVAGMILGSTALLSPVVAMTFVWVVVHYLSALPLPHCPLSPMTAGVLGLLILWGLCGLTTWGTRRGVRRLERRTREGERGTACH